MYVPTLLPGILPGVILPLHAIPFWHALLPSLLWCIFPVQLYMDCTTGIATCTGYITQILHAMTCLFHISDLHTNYFSAMCTCIYMSSPYTYMAHIHRLPTASIFLVCLATCHALYTSLFLPCLLPSTYSLIHTVCSAIF